MTKSIDEQIAALQQLKLAEIAARRDAYNIAIAGMTAQYDWELKPERYTPWQLQSPLQGLQSPLQGFRLIGTLSDKSRERIRAWRAEFDNAPNWEETIRSVFYYRNHHGCLTHDGGGWIALDEPRPVTQEQFDAIIEARAVPPEWFKM